MTTDSGLRDCRCRMPSFILHPSSFILHPLCLRASVVQAVAVLTRTAPAPRCGTAEPQRHRDTEAQRTATAHFWLAGERTKSLRAIRSRGCNAMGRRPRGSRQPRGRDAGSSSPSTLPHVAPTQATAARFTPAHGPSHRHKVGPRVTHRNAGTGRARPFESLTASRSVGRSTQAVSLLNGSRRAAK